MRNPFTSLVYQVLCGNITCFVIINNYYGVTAALFNPIKKYNGNRLVFKRFEMIEVGSIKSQRCNNAIHPFMKQVVCIRCFFDPAFCGVSYHQVVAAFSRYFFDAC